MRNLKTKQIVSDYKPSNKSKKVLNDFSAKFEDARTQKEMPYRFLQDRQHEQFIQDCKDLFTGYVPKRDESWKARVFKPYTRNKVIQVIAQLVSSIIKPQVLAQNPQQEIDKNLSQDLDDLFEYCRELDNYDRKFVLTVLQGVVEGTIHLFVGYENRIRKVKEIDDIDRETGEVKFTEKDKKDFEGLYTKIIPNNEIYPGDVYTMEIQDQPYIFRRRLVPYESAETEYMKYKNWKYVKAGTNLGYDEELDLYIEKQEDDFDQDLVEIVEFWCKQTDSYLVRISGVLMTDPDNPIPYDHKQYPIAKGVFEPFDYEFYWGNSLPNKLWHDQTILNTLHRLLLDERLLNVFSPIFSTDKKIMKRNIYTPGIQIQGDARNLTTLRNVMGTSQNETLNAIQTVESSMNQSSVNNVTGGQQPLRSGTATELLNIQENQMKILGLFGNFISFLVEDYSRLQVANILSFYPEIEDMQKITLLDKGLYEGGISDKMIEFTDLPEMTEEEELELSYEVLKREEREQKQFRLLDKDAFRNMDYFVRIEAAPEPKKTKYLEQVMARIKFDQYAQNPLIDQMENTKNLIRANNDDESKLLKKDVPVPNMEAPVPGGQAPQVDQQLAQAQSQEPSLTDLLG